MEYEEENLEKDEDENIETQCKVCELPLVMVSKALPMFQRRENRGSKFYLYKTRDPESEKEMKEPAHNKLINRTSLGRPVFRLRESHAGDPPGLSLRANPSGLVRRLSASYTD
jgi:hypothetical protein